MECGEEVSVTRIRVRILTFTPKKQLGQVGSLYASSRALERTAWQCCFAGYLGCGKHRGNFISTLKGVKW